MAEKKDVTTTRNVDPKTGRVYEGQIGRDLDQDVLDKEKFQDTSRLGRAAAENAKGKKPADEGPPVRGPFEAEVAFKRRLTDWEKTESQKKALRAGPTK